MLVSVFLQSRGPILQLILIYIVICFVPLGLGAVLILSPRRGGNFLNDAFALFPHVEAKDYGKKLLYRALGLILMAFSVFYMRQIYWNIAVPVVRFFRAPH